MNLDGEFKANTKDLVDQIHSIDERPRCGLNYERVYISTPWATYSSKAQDYSGCMVDRAQTAPYQVCEKEDDADHIILNWFNVCNQSIIGYQEDTAETT